MGINKLKQTNTNKEYYYNIKDICFTIYIEILLLNWLYKVHNVLFSLKYIIIKEVSNLRSS